MAINTNEPRNEFIASDSQSQFTFNFKIFSTSDIVAYRTPNGQIANDETDLLILNTDYIVEIDGDNGGTLTLLTTASAGDLITILRELPVARFTEYQQGGDILASTMNNEEDYQTYLIQQNEARQSRYLTIQSSAQNINPTLPSPLSNAYFRWSQDGTSIENDLTPPYWIVQLGLIRDETQTLHDTVVAKEAALSPHYTNIDIVGSDLAGYYIINSADNGFISDALDTPVDPDTSNIVTVAENIQAIIDATAAATSASNSATAAATSELNAASSASSAASSASASATSATQSATSASNSASSATSASTSATSAASSATSAAISASATAADRLAIETIYDNFDDRYLGVKASDPTLDNDGNPLQIGAMYFNSTVNNTRFYNGSTWEDPEATATQAASNASASATAAASSATSASTSETNASTSATSAATSATSAINSANSASSSALAASTSETNAASSATAAATSASNASTSETNAVSSATAAATSAANASTSETNASTYATNASSSATSAATSAANAQAALDAIEGQYLGVQTSDPTLDLNGDPVNDGDWYYNSTTSVTRIYANSQWNNGAVDTSSFALIDSDTTFNSVQFNGGTGTQGTVSWNTDEETLDLIQNGATLQLGQEVQTHCRNNTGSAIANGIVVMATGTIGASGRITVAPYDNTTDPKYIIGITTEDIGIGEDGKVTCFGKVRGVNTLSFTEGSVLYTTTNGGLTSTEPTTGIKNPIAFVINSHTNGTLMVRVNPVNELISYNNLLDKPTIPTVPTNVSAFTNDAGYITGYTETDPVYTASSWYTTTNNSTNWNTAYSWGNHAIAGYLQKDLSDIATNFTLDLGGL